MSNSSQSASQEFADCIYEWNSIQEERINQIVTRRKKKSLLLADTCTCDKFDSMGKYFVLKRNRVSVLVYMVQNFVSILLAN